MAPGGQITPGGEPLLDTMEGEAYRSDVQLAGRAAKGI